MLEARGGLRDARTLDLYAGTGALGLEALSRGAAHVTFVERRREALAALRDNVAALGVGDAARVVGRPVEAIEGELSGPFDLIFADPPYADVQSGAAPRALGRVLEGSVLCSDEAVMVLEHSSKTKAPSLATLTLVETRAYGDTQISFYVRSRPSDPSRGVEL
jgi:16S rRNA (guanine966-N2)-methyltransferase